MKRKFQQKREKTIDTPKYIISSDNVRSVVSYVHEFKTFVKGRWLGKELLAVLSREFGSHSKEYWEEAIAAGNVRINNKITSPTHILRNGEALLHRTHRHEPPVMGRIEFVQELGDLIAVCKPASMPMHPCGAYRQNSLTTILHNVTFRKL